jgi:hypothetical protein
MEQLPAPTLRLAIEQVPPWPSATVTVPVGVGPAAGHRDVIRNALPVSAGLGLPVIVTVGAPELMTSLTASGTLQLA